MTTAWKRVEVAEGETMSKLLGTFRHHAGNRRQTRPCLESYLPAAQHPPRAQIHRIHHEDSLHTPHLDHWVYEASMTEYVVFSFIDD